MKKLFSRFMLPKYGTRALMATGAKSIEVVGDLLTPLIIARMIDTGITSGNIYDIIRYGLLLVLIACIGFAFTIFCQYNASIVSQGIGTDLRSALFVKVQELSSVDVHRLGTDTLVTRLINDINQVQVMVALGIRQLMRWPILAVGSIVATFLIDPQLGSVFLGATLIVGIIFWCIIRRTTVLFHILQESLDMVSLFMREMLSGVRVIRVFRREESERVQFAQAVDRQTHIAATAANYSALLNPATFFIMYVGIAFIFWIAAPQVTSRSLSAGSIVALVGYMTQTLLAVGYIANLIIIVTRGVASTHRVMEVLDTSPGLSDEKNAPITLSDQELSDGVALELRDATLTYDGGGDPALSHISLTVPAGTTLGIIGGTGSGKSSLAKLCERLYEPEEGSVEVFGHAASIYTFSQLRHLVSLVPQHASLVSGTIRTNLTWRDAHATDEDLWKALELAQAADFVREKPRQLDSPVEAGGTNFSGGQRQRLTIARALVGNPRIVILDDSASALDFATDASLRGALYSLRTEVTSVIISQRVAAVMQADQILVLDHGHQVGLGTHKELLATCPLYKEICLSQLRPEEVEA